MVKVDVLWVKCEILEQGMSKRRWWFLVEFISIVTGIHSVLYYFADTDCKFEDL